MEQKLLETIKAVCPQNCEVEILPTKRRGNVKLIVIKYPPETINEHFDIDDWAIEKVHDLHHNKVRPLEVPAGEYKTIYCCGDKFVFYSHFGGVFRHFKGHLYCDGYGDREYQKYVGVCSDIDEVITYLTTIEKVIF